MKKSLSHRLIRRKARFQDVATDRFTVRIAKTASEYAQAFRLVRATYVAQGIQSVRSHSMRIWPQHLLPESTVLVAYEGDRLVGTMTVVLDSPAGLPLDADYAVELSRVRGPDATLVEYGALAIAGRVHHAGVTLLLNIAAYHVARNLHGATHTVVGINPDAAPIYEAIYNFHSLGEARHHAHLNAPVAAMIQDMSRWPAFCARKFRRPMRTGRLPLEHFEGLPLPGVEMPASLPRRGAWGQWKLPRKVFRELFIRQTNTVAELDSSTYSYLRQQRSRLTLEIPPDQRAAIAKVDSQRMDRHVSSCTNSVVH